MPRKKVQKYYSFTFGVMDFKDFLEEMKRFIKEHPKAIEYDGDPPLKYWIEQNDDYISFNCEELETDEEYKLRLKEEERQERHIEKQDYKKYLELKKKFG